MQTHEKQATVTQCENGYIVRLNTASEFGDEDEPEHQREQAFVFPSYIGVERRLEEYFISGGNGGGGNGQNDLGSCSQDRSSRVPPGGKEGGVGTVDRP